MVTEFQSVSVILPPSVVLPPQQTRFPFLSFLDSVAVMISAFHWVDHGQPVPFDAPGVRSPWPSCQLLPFPSLPTLPSLPLRLRLSHRGRATEASEPCWRDMLCRC